MTLHRADIGAIASFAAGGGFSGLFGFVAVANPGHAALWGAAAGLFLSLGGLIRIIANPTPTNQVTLVDRNSGATVSVRTVNAPLPPKSLSPAAAVADPPAMPAEEQE